MAYTSIGVPRSEVVLTIASRGFSLSTLLNNLFTLEETAHANSNDN